LLAAGVLVSRPDPAHGRRRLIGLSDETAAKVRTYLTVAIATEPYIA
jgi:hypothetical protein